MSAPVAEVDARAVRLMDALRSLLGWEFIEHRLGCARLDREMACDCGLDTLLAGCRSSLADGVVFEAARMDAVERVLGDLMRRECALCARGVSFSGFAHLDTVEGKRVLRQCTAMGVHRALEALRSAAKSESWTTCPTPHLAHAYDRPEPRPIVVHGAGQRLSEEPLRFMPPDSDPVPIIAAGLGISTRELMGDLERLDFRARGERIKAIVAQADQALDQIGEIDMVLDELFDTARALMDTERANIATVRERLAAFDAQSEKLFAEANDAAGLQGGEVIFRPSPKAERKRRELEARARDLVDERLHLRHSLESQLAAASRAFLEAGVHFRAAAVPMLDDLARIARGGRAARRELDAEVAP